MERPRTRRLFFTGTDTDVGKTYVAALAASELLHLGLNVAVYKPVASGCTPAADGSNQRTSGDAMRLWEASGCRGNLNNVCPQRFLAPLAPQAAAMAEGRSVDETLLIDGLDAVIDQADIAVIEGAGGLLSPLSQALLNSDVAAKLDAELIIVAANRLGVIPPSAGYGASGKSTPLARTGDRTELHHQRRRCFGIVQRQHDYIVHENPDFGGSQIWRFTNWDRLVCLTADRTQAP
jgi:dethiobiotin synthase